ncbi:alpha/beta hydrolase family protein (macronuclear) [Tetrahymena thermophila SB210]|uniref:Alpha/beta hydrolase family protein n=1 Tax=Tetrahymena thermophila (strain SB210) TaxID=312017 RepID=I7M8J2_TETTS|nr:alpha/beta hydrolase family protein [Tetrahymena thermophila SB210]EAR98281.2 alpha/beta hydrolase family protein [Tetrahymena thermophila SB210]|eukprot:XP_001018526.2 alpha/beta hydrolase family protein [Tetrahymena thermophila SB210]
MIRKLANYIIRPQRVIYEDSDLGEKQFMHNYSMIHREDFDLKNKRDQTIKCSLFRQKSYEFGSQQNCVIFCHGNSGNRTAIFECLNFILDRGFLAFCFDFTGCGNSDGDHITLGYKESQDLETVVDYVKSLGYVNKIAIWGRSMGAATTLLYVKENPNAVDAICLDSPFANLKILIYEFIQKFKVFADIFGDILYQKVKAQIEQDWNVNIDNINPIECTQHVRIPAIFLHALHDTIINKDHSDKIVKLYKGRKKYYNFSGGHNDIRNDQLYNEVMNFFEEIFGKSQTSITSCHNLEDYKQDNIQSFNPINFSTSSFGGDSDIKNDLLTEQQKDRLYVNRQAKRSKIFFKTENLINKDGDNDAMNRSFVKIRDLNIQRRISKKKTTILLKNFVEMTEDSDDDYYENQDTKTQYNKILTSNGNIKNEFQQDDNLPIRSKSNSILKSSTVEIIIDNQGRERGISPSKKNQLSGRQLHSQEFEVDDDEFDCEDNQKHMPNTNECFSFKKYSIYKHASSNNHEQFEKTSF